MTIFDRRDVNLSRLHRVIKRCILVLLFLVSLVSNSAIAQVDEKDPLQLQAVLSAEYVRLLNPPSGSPHDEQRMVLILPLKLDSKDLIKADLGEIYFQGMFIKEDPQLMSGRPLLNDYHAYSNMRAEDRTQVFELFWSQSWEQTTARVGKIDANDHFAVSEHESHLVNGAAGYSPSIFGLPSYPDSAWSVSVEYQLPKVDLSIGIFDGGSTSLDGTPTGSQMGFSPSVMKGGLFYIAQASFHIGNQSPTKVKSDYLTTSVQQDRDFDARAPVHFTIGAWHHQGEVVELEGEKLTSSGLYLTGDLDLATFYSKSELGIGFQVAMSPHYHPLHASLAMTWSEFAPKIAWAQHGPSLAIGISYLKLGDELIDQSKTPLSAEQLFEATLELPLSASLLFNISWLGLTGAHIPTPLANLLLCRVSIGAL